MARLKVRRPPSKKPPSASSPSSEEDTPPPKTPKPAKKKKQDAVTQPQQDDVESDDSDSGSPADVESEDTEDSTPPETSKPDAVTPPQLQYGGEAESDSVSGSDDESEEESDSEPKTTAAGVVKFESTRSVGEKRRVTDAEGTLLKRAKKDAEESEEKSETKKKLFERTWSEEDEIVLLEGIREFTENKKINPAKDIYGFYDFINKSLHFDVKLIQLKDKIRRLEKRFYNLVKGKKGENKTFSRPHEQKLFDLSKKIWGSAIMGGGSAIIKSNVKGSEGRNTGNVKEDKMDEMKISEVTWSLGRNRFLEMANLVAKHGPDVVDGEEKTKMEEKFKDLLVEELELFLQQIELLKYETKLILASYKGK